MRTPEQMQGMLCPVDKTPLAMSDRQGVEIDYCPTCRGVWLDRGELDKIIERNAQAAPQPAPAPQQAAPPPPPQPGYGSPWGSHPGHHGHYGYKKRKKSFLEELFD